MTIIEKTGQQVSAGDVRVGDKFACVESEKRNHPRRTLTVKSILLGEPPTALCVSARDGMANIEVRIALYRLINPTKFRLFERAAAIPAEGAGAC